MKKASVLNQKSAKETERLIDVGYGIGFTKHGK